MNKKVELWELATFRIGCQPCTQGLAWVGTSLPREVLILTGLVGTRKVLLSTGTMKKQVPLGWQPEGTKSFTGLPPKLVTMV